MRHTYDDGHELDAIDLFVIAMPLFEQTAEKGHKHFGYCPFCRNPNPGFAFDAEKNKVSCAWCSASGDIFDLWQASQGSPTRADAIRDLCAEHKIDPASVNPPRPAAPPPPPPEKPAEGPSAEPVLSGAEGLRDLNDQEPPASSYEGLDQGSSDGSDKAEPAEKEKKKRGPMTVIEGTQIDEADLEILPPISPMDEFMSSECWAWEALKDLNARIWINTRNGLRYVVLPERDQNGVLVSMRRYSPGAADYKYLNHEKVAGGAKTVYRNRPRFFPRPPAAGTGGVAYLVKSESEVLSARSHGLEAYCLTSRVGLKKDHMEPFRDREVIICYAADKQGVESALKLATILTGITKSAKIVEWPDSMGRVEGRLPDKNGFDLRDWFVTLGKTVDEFTALSSGDAKPQDPRLKYFSGRNFKSPLLVDHILEDEDIITDPVSMKTYKWNGKYWEEHPIIRIEARALELLGIEGESSRADNVAKQIMRRTLIGKDRPLNWNHELICCENEMVEIKTGKAYKHEKSFFCTQMLPFRHDPKANCDTWFRVLKEILPDDKDIIPMLGQFFGYCMTRDVKYEKSLVLIGPGGDGKSTILKVLRSMVGEDNTSSVAIDCLDDPFQAATLYQKLVNIVSETSEKSFGTRMFKQIVSGDSVTVSFKHKDNFQLTPFCKFAFASNTYPQSIDRTDGWYRRLMMIKMERQFDEQTADKDLLAKLFAERSGILNWAIYFLQILQASGRFFEAKCSAEFLEDYRKYNSPIYAFVRQYCEIVSINDEDVRTPKSMIYNAYCAYADDNGIRYRPPSNKFGQEILSVAKIKAGKTKDGKVHVYLGLRLNEEGNAMLQAATPGPRLWREE